MRGWVVVVGLSLWIVALGGRAYSAETDQFMSWGMELEDCSAAFNRHFNEEVRSFIDRMNERIPQPATREEMTIRLYHHLFPMLLSSRIRKWVSESPEVDRFPDASMSTREYRRESIFQRPVFPYILPMFRTIRVGDVYFGIDKVGHFFGFGRRYYQRYLRLVESGVSQEEAEERVVLWGIGGEMVYVGKVVDGVFSHGDLEANYQGFRLARDFCEGDDPFLLKEGNVYSLTRDIDIRDYITPEYDESYNVPVFSKIRQRRVSDILQEKYSEAYFSTSVQARFARYRELGEPSYGKRLVDAHLASKGIDPKKLFPLQVMFADSE